MDTMKQDVRFGLRQVRRTPMVSLFIVATLAVGIGASTAIFSVVNTVLLRPLPYAHPERLGYIVQDMAARGVRDFPMPPGDLLDLRVDATLFESIALLGTSANAPLRSPGSTVNEPIVIANVTSNVFDVLGVPAAVGRTTQHVGPEDFTHPVYRAVWEAVAASGGPQAGATDPGWNATLISSASDPVVASAMSELMVDPLTGTTEPTPPYVLAHVCRLQELTTMRRITEVKSRLQRTNPVEHAADYNRMFGELVALEQHRRVLREHAVGAQ